VLCDREAVEVRELDIEQEDVGLQFHRGSDGSRPVSGLADDGEARGLEQRARSGAKAAWSSTMTTVRRM
jgi:hypothetical protein